MKKHNIILLTIPILLMAAACQTIFAPRDASLPEELSFTSTSTSSNSAEAGTTPTSDLVLSRPTLTAPSTTPTIPNTLTPEPTATILLQTETPKPTELPQELMLAIFEELWSIVDQEYLYADFNGLDWNAIYQEYRQRLHAGLTNSEFYLLMNEMIFRLGDEHSRFLTPEEVKLEDAEYEGNSDYVGVGILVSAIPERDRAVILAVFPDSPADQAGLKPRDGLLSVDGQPILDEYGSIRDIVRGPEGTEVSLTIQSPGEEPHEVKMTRGRITGALPIFSMLLETNDGSIIGYIQIVTFADGTVDEQVRDALYELSSETGLDGLILDNRLNNGGANTVMTAILSYFTSGTMGYFVSRENRHSLVIEEGEDINGSMSVPLVVLIGNETVSYGEVFSGILNDLERAYLIGDTTEGNIETLWGYDFADGSRAWIAHDTFVPYNHPDEDWEAAGISPDMFVEGYWYDFTLQDDPAIQAGIDYLESLE